jgi:hypothetical protein
MSNATMSSINPKSETFFERHTWKVFFGLSIIVVLFGLGDMLASGSTFARSEAPTLQRITGMTWEQVGASGSSKSTSRNDD